MPEDDYSHYEDDSKEPSPERMPGFVRGSETSKASAKKVRGPRRNSQARRILRHIAATGGHTTDEVQYDLSLKHQSASPRMTDLTNAGCLVITTERRLTSSGSEAEVYALADGTSEELEQRWTQWVRDQNKPSMKGVREWKRAVFQAVYDHARAGTDVTLAALDAIARQAPITKQQDQSDTDFEGFLASLGIKV